MRASPATTIMRPIVRARRTLPAMDRRTDAVELLDGPLDDPRGAGRQPARPAPDQPLARRGAAERGRDRCAGRASRRADPARRRDRRRRHPDGAAGPGRRARARGLSIVAHRQPARGPRRGRARHTRPSRSPTGSSSTSATGGRSPSPTGRSTSPTPRWSSTTCAPAEAVTSAARDGPGRAARRGRQRSRSAGGSAGSAPGCSAHLLTRNRYTRQRRAALGPARRIRRTR